MLLTLVIDLMKKMAENNYKGDINTSNHNDIRVMSLDMMPECKLLLDVGCACGDYGKFVLSTRDKVEIYGIDVDQNSLNEASLTNAYAYLEKVDLDLPLPDSILGFSQKFDCISALDVIEHTKNPKNVLSSLIGFLKPGGCILISVPNIAYGAVKANLLCNQFNYEKTGILDETHLRFFTSNSLENVLTELGLEITESNARIELFDIESVLPFLVRNRIESDVQSYVYQILVSVRLSKLSDNALKASNKRYLKFDSPKYRRLIRKMKTRRALLQFSGRLIPKSGRIEAVLKYLWNDVF